MLSSISGQGSKSADTSGKQSDEDRPQEEDQPVRRKKRRTEQKGGDHQKAKKAKGGRSTPETDIATQAGGGTQAPSTLTSSPCPELCWGRDGPTRFV